MQNLIHRPVYKFLSTMEQFNKHLMLTITLPIIMHGNYMPDMSNRLKRVRNEMVLNLSSSTLELNKDFDGMEVVRDRYYYES